MTTMMSCGLFICATMILPITAVNKNKVPYAVHPDPHPAECAEANMQQWLNNGAELFCTDGIMSTVLD